MTTPSKGKPKKVSTTKVLDPAIAAEIRALEAAVKNDMSGTVTPAVSNPAADAPAKKVTTDTKTPEQPPIVAPVLDAHVDVPPADDDKDEGLDSLILRSSDSEDPTPAALGIFHANCLRCTAFLSDDLAAAVGATDSFIKKCHYEHGINKRQERGNPNCPAAYLRLVHGVNIDATATQMANAWAANDVDRVAEISESLKLRDPIVSARVMREAKIKMTQMEKNGS